MGTSEKKMRRNTARKRKQVTKSTGTSAMSSQYLPGAERCPGRVLSAEAVCLYVSVCKHVCVYVCGYALCMHVYISVCMGMCVLCVCMYVSAREGV